MVLQDRSRVVRNWSQENSLIFQIEKKEKKNILPHIYNTNIVIKVCDFFLTNELNTSTHIDQRRYLLTKKKVPST